MRCGRSMRQIGAWVAPDGGPRREQAARHAPPARVAPGRPHGRAAVAAVQALFQSEQAGETAGRR